MLASVTATVRSRPVPDMRLRSRRATGRNRPGAARTPWRPHRMRDVAAFARHWAHRKGDGPMDTGPGNPIQDQLRALQPICSAQRVSTGITCGAPAAAVVEIHAIDGCEQIGITPDGDLVETLWHACLATVQCA